MKMNKRLLTAVAVASIFAGMSSAHAATATGNFNVTVNLTSKCEISAGPTDVAFTYTSFQAGAAASTGGAYTVRCTNTLPYTMSLDATSGTVVGLNYTLALSAASGTGNGAGQNYSITGSMVSGQGGTCALGSCSGTDARVLTITY
jgi:spore coat protein U-like protein